MRLHVLWRTLWFLQYLGFLTVVAQRGLHFKHIILVPVLVQYHVPPTTISTSMKDSRGTEHYAQSGKQVVCGSCVFDIICHYGLCRDTKKMHFWQICQILAHSQKCHKTLKWHKNDTKTAQKWHKKCVMPQKRHKKCAMPQKWHKKCAMPQKMCLFCAPDKIHDSKHNGICHGMGIIINTQKPLTAIRGQFHANPNHQWQNNGESHTICEMEKLCLF